GQAKWVGIPRGAATVSGERHPRAGKAGCHCYAEAARSAAKGNGKAGMPQTIREPGYLEPGGPFPVGARHAEKEHHVASLRPFSACKPALLHSPERLRTGG